MVLDTYDHKLSHETMWLVRVRNLFIYFNLTQKYDIQTHVKAAVLSCTVEALNV